jgi:hypothetical protein
MLAWWLQGASDKGNKRWQVVAEWLALQQFRPRHAFDVVSYDISVLTGEFSCVKHSFDWNVVRKAGETHPEVTCRCLFILAHRRRGQNGGQREDCDPTCGYSKHDALPLASMG